MCVAMPRSHNSMSFSKKFSLHFPNLNEQSTETKTRVLFMRLVCVCVCGAVAKENHNALLRFNGEAIKRVSITKRIVQSHR